MQAFVTIPFPRAGRGRSSLRRLSNPSTFFTHSISPRSPFAPMAAISTTVPTDKSADSSSEQTPQETLLPLQVCDFPFVLFICLFSQLWIWSLLLANILLEKGSVNEKKTKMNFFTFFKLFVDFDSI